jgi:hypothetical protein
VVARHIEVVDEEPIEAEADLVAAKVVRMNNKEMPNNKGMFQAAVTLVAGVRVLLLRKPLKRQHLIPHPWWQLPLAEVIVVAAAIVAAAVDFVVAVDRRFILAVNLSRRCWPPKRGSVKKIPITVVTVVVEIPVVLVEAVTLHLPMVEGKYAANGQNRRHPKQCSENQLLYMHASLCMVEFERNESKKEFVNEKKRNKIKEYIFDEQTHIQRKKENEKRLHARAIAPS